MEAEQPPVPPEEGACCGSGCERCVWDVYYEKLEEFDKKKKHTPPVITWLNRPTLAFYFSLATRKFILR